MARSNKVLQELQRRLVKSAFSRGTRLIVVMGHARSDIGKGTLVANLLRLLPGASVIKFDGVFNSNLDGRYPSTKRTDTDFALYADLNPEMEFSSANLLLGGTILGDFIAEYGETNELLMFRPHLITYFKAILQEHWQALGKPNILIVEIGGVLEDLEVEAYALTAIRGVRRNLGEACKLILMTELAYNNEYIKTRPVSNGVLAMRARGLRPDIILAREPNLGRLVSERERQQFEKLIREKLLEYCDDDFGNVVTVPFFAPDVISSHYATYLESRLLPLVTGSQHE